MAAILRKSKSKSWYWRVDSLKWYSVAVNTKKLPLVLACATTLAACATVKTKTDLVVKRAHFDLNCEDSIEVVELGGASFGAGEGEKQQSTSLCAGVNTPAAARLS